MIARRRFLKCLFVIAALILCGGGLLAGYNDPHKGAISSRLLSARNIGVAFAISLSSGYVTNGAEGATLSIGDAPAEGERRFIVIVAAAFDASGFGGSPTIGGVAATVVDNVVGVTDTSPRVAIYYREVPSGTTAAIVSNWTGSPTASRVHVYRVIVTGGGNLLVYDSTPDVDSDPLLLNANVVNSGFAIGGAFSQNGGALTWTGLTENFESDLSGGEYFSSASLAFTADEAARTIEANFASTPDGAAGLVVSFRAG